MTFNDTLDGLDRPALYRRLQTVTATDVERVLRRESPPSDEDLAVIFSPAAVPYLEALAQRAAAVSERRFGRVVSLYAPLYLSNECVNRCAYCGFSGALEIPRITLTPAQAIEEARILYDEGFRHILLVSGESPRAVSMEYLREVVHGLREQWHSISIEIRPLDEDEYRVLADDGVVGLALYQETYDPERYAAFHPAGPKHDFRNRIDAIERGGRAGFRSLGIGALLGLNDWRFEAVVLAMHGRYLARRFWQSRIAVSFPRLRSAAACYQPEFLVSDPDLVQMICGMRLALPDAELVLSTRESATMRDHLVPLGVNRMSAGSRTNPGGYGHPRTGGEQFEVSDDRSPDEIARMIAARGYEPVWKDADRELVTPC